MKLLVFGLLAMGFLLLSGIQVTFRLPQWGELRKLMPRIERNETMKDVVARVNGTAKENYFRRTHDEAYTVMRKTGQGERFSRTKKFAAALSGFGVFLSLISQNLLLAPVLGVGLYFIPLWCTKFYMYRYKRYVNDELEVALNMITTSYLRTNDIIASVSENTPHMGGLVRKAFAGFATSVQSINPNVVEEIMKLKGAFDTPLFWSWCEILTLCQSDYTLRGALPPIVSKFSVLKAQQLENETNMMLPMKEALIMIGLTVGIIPLLYLINPVWFGYLVHSLYGQIAMAVTAVAVFFAVNKAISLSGPIEFNI